MDPISSLPAPQSSSNLVAYFNKISHIPILSAEQEYALARRWKDHQDQSAVQTLIMSNLRFVAHVARGYMGYGLPLEDLIQEGNVGLLKAATRFEPEHEARLPTFAGHWIRSEIHEYVLRNWGMVKVATTKAQRKLFFNLRRIEKAGQHFSPSELSAIALQLNVPEFEVKEMETRFYGGDIAFDAPHEGEAWGEREPVSPSHYLTCDSYDVADHYYATRHATEEQERLASALHSLEPRSRDIIQSRMINEKKSTLGELAQRYTISTERVRQLERNALKTLKASLLAA